MQDSVPNHTADPKFRNGAGFVDGEIVPIAEAKIPILDRGFLHSDATYDVVHVWNNRFFRLDDHIARFMNGIDKLHMAIDLDRSQIRDILSRCVKATGFKDAYVEMICTRGVPAENSRDPRQCRNTFYAFVIPFSWIATMEDQERGLRLHISAVQRISPEAVDPTIKNYHWLDLVKGQFDAYANHSDLAVLSDTRGNVVEGGGFNVFAVSGDTVTTPRKGVLHGITRKTAMELAMQIGLEVQERELPAAELLRADEVFITSTAGGVMPIKFVNNQLIGDGRSKHATRLRALYWDAHNDPLLSEPV